MTLLEIEPKNQPPMGMPLLRLGFRPFFLLAGLAAAVLMIAWILVFFKGAAIAHYGAVSWHAHEMIFGYTVAVIAGFLLTAEKNWTGVHTAKGFWLGSLALLWLAGRIAPFVGYPAWLIAIIDLSFLPLLSVALLLPLIKTSQYKHLIFVIILMALFIANLLFHLGLLYPDMSTSSLGIRLGWLSILLMITVMGGRVIPFFIERGTGEIGKITSNRWLELISFLTLCLWMICSLVLSSTIVIATLAVIAACFQIMRLYHWYLHSLWRHPMLWILYLGYAWIPVGLLLYAYAISTGQGISTAVHAITAGGIGLLTIGMMSRVSLGHTGREIEASTGMIMAFVLVVIGAFLRVIGSLTQIDVINQYYTIIVSGAGVFWAVGFLVFLIIFAPMLLRPRIDNAPG